MLLSGQSIIGEFSASSDKQIGTQGNARFLAMNPTTELLRGSKPWSGKSTDSPSTAIQRELRCHTRCRFKARLRYRSNRRLVGEFPECGNRRKQL